MKKDNVEDKLLDKVDKALKDKVILEQNQELIDNEEINEIEVLLLKNTVDMNFSEQTDVVSNRLVVKENTTAKPIDISSLKVSDVNNDKDKSEDLRAALFGNKTAYQVVAAQSGYMAHVAPLGYSDIVSIYYSTLDTLEYQKLLYKTLHDKILKTSVGRLGYGDFLNSTSVEDVETLYYGLYMSTFQNDGMFRYKCPKCGEEHDYKIDNRTLIGTSDSAAMLDRTSMIRKNPTRESMEALSLLNDKPGIELTKSKLVIELRTPSLSNSLEMLATVPEDEIEKSEMSATIMLYINRVLIPNPRTKQYHSEINRKAILRMVEALDIDDARELELAITKRVNEHRINYSIKNLKCPKCGHTVNEIPVSPKDILFHVISEKLNTTNE